MEKKKVFICTDLNVGFGDPDDMQSFGHLLMYADELNITGIVPDSWGHGGYEEMNRVLDNLYRDDYENENFNFKKMGFPTPEELMGKIASTPDIASDMLVEQALKAKECGDPLYILVWGDMSTIKNALIKNESIKDTIRILTIGTFIRPKSHGGDGTIRNWNDNDDVRKYIWNLDKNIWWLENESEFNGMFVGSDDMSAKDVLSAIANDKHGKVGNYIADCVKGTFREGKFDAGDTPTVLYVIDNNHDIEDPTTMSWAGKYTRPFADRPNYYIDGDGGFEWDFEKPLNTWHNADNVFFFRKAVMKEIYNDMANAFIEKADRIYNVK